MTSVKLTRGSSGASNILHSSAPLYSNSPPPYPGTPLNATPSSLLPLTKVEIRLSCLNLPNLDILSKSDPFVVLYLQTSSSEGRRWKEHARTETIMDCLNPDFVKCFQLDYYFESIQNLKFEVYDLDCQSRNLNDHDFIGVCECTLGSLIGQCHGSVEMPLKNGGKDRGKILVYTEEIKDCKDTLRLKFSGKKLDKKDFFGLSDPFLVFYRYNEDNSLVAIHKTETIKKTLNPSWNVFELSVQTLCNGDCHRPVKVICFDHNKSGNHDLIGEFTTTVNEIKSVVDGSQIFDLLNPKKKGKKGYRNSGTIVVEQVEILSIPTFVDFLHAGMELCFTVAIDFTASNGDPNSPDSLHFRSPYAANEYVQAIAAVGKVCEDYDSDKLFPAFGFGARTPPSYNVDHCFPLNGMSNAECFGVQGILEAYYRTLSFVQLYGPTNFSPIICSVSRLAAISQKQSVGKSYHVLLIITDGIITDFELTKEAIVKASALPMSIIMVGVGSAEFDAMEELDGDDKRLSSRGLVAARDIVQFVPFRDFANQGPNAGEALAREVLAELPDQVVSYMRSKGVRPGL